MSKTRLEIANERIKSFVERFGKAHLYLAYHAAFPLALTPDLLYCLWVQFQRDIDDQVLGIPWIAVADLLVSNLCNEVGYELYEMDLAVRNELLNRLQEDKKFGQQRINQLSNFLLDYVKPKLESKDPDIQDFALTQEWAALAYTQPSKLAHELALEFEKLDDKDTAGLVRMASLTEIFTEPLAEFQPLLIYARVMVKFARGNFKAAKDELRKVGKKGDVIQVAGVSLPIPERIQPNQKKHKFIARVTSVVGMIVTTLLGVSVGFGVYQWSTPCLANEKKVLGVLCVVDPKFVVDPKLINISSGDRILFSNIHNTSRYQAIQAFQKRNYSKAVELFEKAVTDNRNDAEVWIYYNNAKAHDKAARGDEYSPLTLAVVVPGNDQSKAQEILRGVAQSQEQFNVNGGQNGRLLEILIANDADDEEQAKNIAKNLVQKDFLLGVIGHASSQTTQAALNIYKQADLPLISPTNSANTLQEKIFFRTTPSDAAFGEKLGKYATNSSLKKVVIFYNPQSLYSNSFKAEFRNNFRGEISRLIDVTDPKLDIEKELQESASQQVQAVMLFPDIKYTATALEVAKVNLDKNLGLKLLGGDSLYNKKTLDDGKNFEGLVLAVPWFREAPQAKDFSQAAKQQWLGDISWRTATSYDATQAFIKSLSSQPSRATILQRLQNLNLSPKGTSEDNLVTSGDDLKFKNGERQSKAILVTVDQGQFKCLHQCSP